MAYKVRHEETVKAGLSFFSRKITAINTQRIQLNRGKGLARYLAQSKKNLRSLEPLDTSLGVMSFVLYMLRFYSNLCLLLQLTLGKKTEKKEREDLYFSLLNDMVWSCVNLTQFFWLSYRKSPILGQQGMQLETLAQCIDLLVLIIRYQQDRVAFEKKYQQASLMERKQMAIEWHFKELNFMRSVIASIAIVTVFAVFFFSSTSLPFSPLLCSLVLLNSLSKLIMDIEKDKQLIHHMKRAGAIPTEVAKEYQLKKLARIKDVHQMVLNNALIPLGLLCILTTQAPIALALCLGLVIAHFGSLYLINHHAEQPCLQVSHT